MKLIRSGRPFEERTQKSTAGSPAVYSRTRGFGKPKLDGAAHPVSHGSQTNQPRAEKTVGEDPKGIAANSGNCFGSRETHAKNLSGGQKENRGCRTRSLGKVPGGEEEGGLR
ncbi:MAG: hypothetical protein WCA20_24525 [Candidatus Sulfotelmatobacter sp.]